MKKVLICGLPNSGKSQFRRYLVKVLRDNGIPTEHWDADRFKKARCAADEDMKEPPDDESTVPKDTVWLIEDVRGTVPHKEVVARDEKAGAWKPLEYYDAIIYLKPDTITHALFWVSRALQWQKAGAGNWLREAGDEKLDNEDLIVRNVRHYLVGNEQWFDQDWAVLAEFTKAGCWLADFAPTMDDAGDIKWEDFPLDDFVEFMQFVGWKRRDNTEGKDE